MRHGIAVALLVVGLWESTPAVAQQSQTGQSSAEQGIVRTPVLIIDTDQMFRDSAFGKRVAEEDRARRAALSAENRRITADLENEEKKLTGMRTEMEAEAFRRLADAFDAKVQQTEQAQLEKIGAFAEILDQERTAFLRAAEPVLEQLMLQAGAVVILESRAVLFRRAQVDITEEAIGLLDETIGSGLAPE